MRGYLIFQLYGPLVAWGEQAVGEARNSATRPGRSALLGLLAAALGLRRDDEAGQQRLAESLKFGVKTCTMGTVLKDYHTSQVPPHDKKAKHWYTRRDELRHSRKQPARQRASLDLPCRGPSLTAAAIRDTRQRCLRPFGRP